MSSATTAVSQMAFTVRFDDEAHLKLRSMCGEASRPPTAWARSTPASNETSLSPLLSDAIVSLLSSNLYPCIPNGIYGEVPPPQNSHWIQLAWALPSCSVKSVPPLMGFAVRVRSAGQIYGPTCHQRDRADVTGFVTLVRLSSLGQHVGVLALAGYKRRKSALTAGPICPHINYKPTN